MFTTVRRACVFQHLYHKNVTGLFGVNKSSVICWEKLFYSSGERTTSQELNSNLQVGEEGASAAVKKKPPFSPKVTVLSSNSEVTVMTLEEAQKLSKRRDLKLVRVADVDHKSTRPVYKLMSGTDYFREDLIRRKDKLLKKNDETKPPKLLTLSAKIADHDLSSKIKNIIKWLNKRQEVRIIVNAGDNDERAEHIYKRMETETKHAGKIVQKRKKDGNLKFQIISLNQRDFETSLATQPVTQPSES